jgi:hypothetical protein
MSPPQVGERASFETSQSCPKLSHIFYNITPVLAIFGLCRTCYAKTVKVVVLYHQNSEHAGLVQDFAHDYEWFKGKKLELISLETVQGADMANLYGVTEYPTFLAIADSGTMQRMWQGMPMLLMDELSYYTQDQDVHNYASVTSHRLKILQPPTLTLSTAVF